MKEYYNETNLLKPTKYYSKQDEITKNEYYKLNLLLLTIISKYRPHIPKILNYDYSY